eukprot:133106-Amphidinium_carterae.2
MNGLDAPSTLRTLGGFGPPAALHHTPKSSKLSRHSGHLSPATPSTWQGMLADARLSDWHTRDFAAFAAAGWECVPKSPLCPCARGTPS